MTVSTASITSTTQVQGSFPSCKVTVYLTGTLTIATIYSNNSGTVTLNPFTAANDGFWFFYANDGVYDVRMENGGIPSPFTRGGNQAFDLNYLAPFSGAQSRTIKNKQSDIISVKDFGALGDDVHDDTTAVQNALNAASNTMSDPFDSNTGAKVYFPCEAPNFSYLVTNTITIPKGITIFGDVSPGCRIHYRSTQARLAAFFLAQDSVTIRDIKLYSDSTGAMGVVPPKVVLLVALQKIGSTIAGETGHHQIHDMSVSGYASSALVYSIASEENSWFSDGLYLEGGGANYVLYVSNMDGLNICGGLCPTQTDFHGWFENMHIVQFPTNVGTPSVDSAGFYLQTNPATGDIHLTNSFIGMGPPGGRL